jgi:hypothetical protein
MVPSSLFVYECGMLFDQKSLERGKTLDHIALQSGLGVEA